MICRRFRLRADARLALVCTPSRTLVVARGSTVHRPRRFKQAPRRARVCSVAPERPEADVRLLGEVTQIVPSFVRAERLVAWSPSFHTSAGVRPRLTCGSIPDARAGRTNSAIRALNLAGSSTNGSWPECSNQTSLFDGAFRTSMYATLASAGTQWSLRPRK